MVQPTPAGVTLRAAASFEARSAPQAGVGDRGHWHFYTRSAKLIASIITIFALAVCFGLATEPSATP